MRPAVGSFFSGIGGLDLGFECAGFHTAWMSEIDAYASDVLRYRFSNSLVLGDIKSVKGNQLVPVDVIAFGSPCQDLSRGGDGKGLAGERSGLFYEAIRVIRELIECGSKPRFIVWENVPGALTSNNGEDFACVLQAFLDIGATDVAWRVLDSQGFGVPSDGAESSLSQILEASAPQKYLVSSTAAKGIVRRLKAKEKSNQFFRTRLWKALAVAADTGTGQT